MRRLPTLAVLGCLAWAAPGKAQEKFVLELELQSQDFPSLDSEKKITGKAGDMYEFDAVLHLTSSGLPGEEGPQGWSLGVRNDKVEILGTTWAGTKTDDKSNGGLWEGGFRVFTVIDPANAKNMGKMGMTAAVVLSLTEGTSLPANTKQPVGKNRYKATIPGASTDGFIRYEDGLVGKGQPVPNNITYKGSTVIPVKSEVVLTLAPEGPAVEECTNGKDDDGDSKVDCADPDCSANAACKEDCDDTIDNDLDGKTDCADSDCTADPACTPKVEDCDDKVDNDGDSKVDCADSDCAADPACTPKVEDCDDKVDNDGDSKVDCDDTDCSADPACKVVGDKGFDLVLDAPGTKREGNLNVLEIANKAGTEIIVTASIAPTKDPEEVGAQGWSISVTHETPLTITKSDMFPTIDGTDAAKLFSGGFKKTEVVDPAKNGGKEGFVSAVVLSLTEAINLDGTKSQSVARSQYTLESGVAKTDFPIDIMFMDGLRGVGQPVPNVITVAGATVTANRLINLQIREGEITPPGEKRFRRGDANDDGKVNIADPIWIINELVRQGPPTECKSAADANDDGRVDLSDAMYLIAWRFQGGPSPPAPGVTNCGTDPTEDTLVCPENSASTCPAP